MREYTNEDVTRIVQHLFQSEAGQYVLDWLTDVYVNYSARHIIQSGLPNTERQLTWKAAQQDLVLNLRSIYEHGLPQDSAPQSSEEDNE